MIHEENTCKRLRMRYSFKELASLMDMSYTTFRLEVVRNANLVQKLKCMGWRHNHRFRKDHVLEIFKVLGYPDGYEWYEKKE